MILAPPESPYSTIKFKQLYKREFALCNANSSNNYCRWNIWVIGNPPTLKLQDGTATEADQDGLVLFRQLFTEKRPSAIRMSLAIYNKESLSSKAKITDSIAELQSPQTRGLGHANDCVALKPSDTSEVAEVRADQIL